MLRALMATEPPLLPDELRADLKDAGIDIVAETTAADLAQAGVRTSPDLVIAASASPSSTMFEAARMLGLLAPCPFIMFTADRDAEKIVLASDSNIHSYVIDGYAKHRLLSIVQVARARFRHEQILKQEFAGLSKRFEERKVVDRAKGVLMRSRGVIEEEAFELLRTLAMRTRQRIGVVAHSVIDMSHAGEAVNRAGQLRMLCQRIVKCYAQALVGFKRDEALEIKSHCMMRVQSNLGILRKAISTKGYGELVERVAMSWGQLFAICVDPPDRARLDELDRLADAMLKDAENLTDFLESSGLTSSLHILNVSGRQRMLCQRIAKLSFFLALDPPMPRLAELQELSEQFQTSMTYLSTVPLSSERMSETLKTVLSEWRKLRAALGHLQSVQALENVLQSSEKLLEACERLTDDYEQAMQILVGDRIGRLNKTS